MNKKLIILLIFIIGIVSISAVSSADTETFGGLDFTIPDGYQTATFDDDSSPQSTMLFFCVDELGSGGSWKSTNPFDDSFIVIAEGIKDIDETIDLFKSYDGFKSMNETEIANTTGNLLEYDDFDAFIFEYGGGTFVVVAPDEDVLTEIMS